MQNMQKELEATGDIVKGPGSMDSPPNRGSFQVDGKA